MKKQVLLPSLSKAMNFYLGLDPESPARLKKLNGKVMHITLLPFHFSFQCAFHEKGVHLFQQETEIDMADAKLIGTPLQMAGAVLVKSNRQQFFADDLVMEGDAEFGQQVVDLFDDMQIDWEEHLSHLIGDVPAYHAGRLVNRFKNWFKTADDSLSQSISDYIHEEKTWLPSSLALEDFFQDIDTLRMDADRLEAKIMRLQAHLTEEKEKP